MNPLRLSPRLSWRLSWRLAPVRAVAALLAAALPLLAGGCSTNPATGAQDFTLFMSPDEESRIGAQEHTKIVAAYGGVYDDPQIGAYVAEIGGRIAANSERPDIPFTFTVLDSPVVNAFALPGGYVYITRGLMALASSEAALAGVLGHEIGHVVARHTAQRYSRAVASQLGASILGAVVGSEAVGQLAQTGAGLYLLGFSRDQEYEADQLGIRYIDRAGYDPRGQAHFLQSLVDYGDLESRLAGREARQTRAEFFQTHPNTPDRVARALSAAGGDGRPLRRDVYLERIEGLLYGDNPEQGFVRDRRFLHPRMGFAFEVPEGFRMTNSARAVVARGPNGAAIVFDDAGANTHSDLLTYLQQIWAKNARLRDVERITINGMAAATGRTTGRSDAGAVDLRLVAIQFKPSTIMRFTFATPSGETARWQTEFQRTTYSFRALDPAEAAALKPYRLRVVTVAPGDTVERLAARLPYGELREERFRVLNALPPGQGVQAGQRVKLVVE